MNLYLKKCKKCGCGFDIGINMDICPDCRRKELEGKDERRKKKVL